MTAFPDTGTWSGLFRPVLVLLATPSSVAGGLGLALGLAAAAENDGGWFDVGPGEVAAGTAAMVGFGALNGMGIGTVSETDEWAPVHLQTFRLAPIGDEVTVSASVPLRF